MQFDKTVVKCSPCKLPYSLPIFIDFASRTNNIIFDTSVHIHSDVCLTDDDQREKLLNFLPKQTKDGTKASLKLLLIFTSFSASTHSKCLSFELNNSYIQGEVNLIKYLALKLKICNGIHNVDEGRLDDIYKVLVCNEDLKTFQSLLKEWIPTSKKFISYQNGFGIPDLLAYSHVMNIPDNKFSEPVLLNWKKDCSSQLSCKPKEESEISDEKQKLFTFFKQNQIEFDNIEHPEVFTVEAMMPYLQDITGAVSKNLFLKDKKGNLYLFSVLHDKTVNLTDIAKKIKAPGGGLRFASEDILFDTLGVKQGCVTAYALLNDKKNVKFLLDEDMVNGKFQRVYFHPLINTATTGISTDDFKKFVTLTGHEIISVIL